MDSIILINQDGTMGFTNVQDIIKDENYYLIENYIINGKVLCLYGALDGDEDFNKYEFQKCNPRGIVYVILVDRDMKHHYLSIESFTTFYEAAEDLDTEEDEDEDYSPGEYDSDDSFIDNA